MLYYNKEEIVDTKKTLKMLPLLPVYAYATFASSVLGSFRYLSSKFGAKEVAESASTDIHIAAK